MNNIYLPSQFSRKRSNRLLKQQQQKQQQIQQIQTLQQNSSNTFITRPLTPSPISLVSNVRPPPPPPHPSPPLSPPPSPPALSLSSIPISNQSSSSPEQQLAHGADEDAPFLLTEKEINDMFKESEETSASISWTRHSNPVFKLRHKTQVYLICIGSSYDYHTDILNTACDDSNVSVIRCIKDMKWNRPKQCVNIIYEGSSIW